MQNESEIQDKDSPSEVRLFLSFLERDLTSRPQQHTQMQALEDSLAYNHRFHQLEGLEWTYF